MKKKLLDERVPSVRLVAALREIAAKCFCGQEHVARGVLEKYDERKVRERKAGR